MKPVSRSPRTTAYAARRALMGLRDAENLFNSDRDDGAKRRIGWVASLSTARAIGHALRNVDAKRSPYIKQSIEDAWKRWTAEPLSAAMLFGFVIPERNRVLKEYAFGIGRKDSAEVLFLVGDQAFSPSEALAAARVWWTIQIGEIELNAERLRKEKKQGGSRKR